MLNGRRYNRIHSKTAAFVSIAFLICIITTPITAVQPGRASRNVYKGNQTGTNGVSLSAQRAYLTSESFENELLSFVEYSFISNRILQKNIRVLLRMMDSLLPFAGFGLLLCGFGHFIRKRSQRISILARNIGGHAPPIA